MDNKEILKIDSISYMMRLLGMEETRHPLIEIVDMDKVRSVDAFNERSWIYGFYMVVFKESWCGELTYGRNMYDYDNGTLLFFSPGQVISMNGLGASNPTGLMLMFHPELLRSTSLSAKMKNFSFFSYSSNEALHMSEREKNIFRDCMDNISNELEHAIDKHSKSLIVSNVELLLNYCVRFYDRQFITRENVCKDALSQFEALLSEYFASGLVQKNGMPTVKYFASKLNLSTNYFGDLVKRETGHNPQELIQQHVLELAKVRLTTSTDSVNDIAYSLGFEYPQYFSRLFKSKTGQTPLEFRNMN
jgi:AraC-like DNA-binding protein